MKDLLKALQPIEGVKLNQVITLTPEQAEQCAQALTALENLKLICSENSANLYFENYNKDGDYWCLEKNGQSVTANSLLECTEKAIKHIDGI